MQKSRVSGEGLVGVVGCGGVAGKNVGSGVAGWREKWRLNRVRLNWEGRDRHKCPRKFLLVMTDNDEGSSEEVATGDDEAVESGDISILNSTHNFVRPDVVERMRLPLESTKAFKVYIGSKETLLCEIVCSQVGKVTHDYTHQIMIFVLGETTYTLRGVESLRMKKISLHRIQALLDMDDVYGIYECHGYTLQGEKRWELSFCMDYRAFNLVTVKDKFLIPTADEMFDELGGASNFTKLDLQAGYHKLGTWMEFEGNTRDLGSFGEETDEITDLHQILEEVLLTERGDGVASIKRRRRRRDLFSDGVWNLETVSGRGRLKKDLESYT
nr:retrotransposon-related protein [Tanacetum cinerariifolium]